MSAAELREAASKMRERADGVAATEWFCTSSGVERYDGYDVWTHDGESPWTVATSDFAPTAEHIASWHPLVALAVADWLDLAASHANWRHYIGDGPTADMVDAATAIATAYLGGVR